MPHKHKRKRGDDNEQYELPPTEKARPLTTSKGALFSDAAEQRKGAKRKRARKDDDTPAAFRRLMAFKNGSLPRSGLDDGNSKPKKKQKDTELASVIEESAPAMPKIKPGERLNDFSARVDQALPVTGLTKKGNSQRNADGTRKPNNRAEKRQQNMQKEWRQIDAKYKERLAEAQEEAAEEYEQIWHGIDESKSSKKRRKQSKGVSSEGDLWASVGKARQAPATALIGIHDVVQDIPRFTVAPKAKMKVKNGAVVDIDSIPQTSGSLRRREQLSGSRRKIIDAYRDMSKRRINVESL